MEEDELGMWVGVGECIGYDEGGKAVGVV